MNKEKILAAFKARGFRATPQRIAVYEYVLNHRTHPDALCIYENVVGENPAFSKTTVYNALKALCENGFLAAVYIDDGSVRYDAVVGFHGHFRCSCCGEIFDFDASEPVVQGLSGFEINRKDVYYSGICKGCKNIVNKKE